MTNTDIASASKVMLGTTEAVAMYIGSTLIWQQSSSSLPYDCLIEYLGSTGTLYINTNYEVGNYGLSGEIKMQRTGDSTGEKAYIGRIAAGGFDLYTKSDMGISLWVEGTSSFEVTAGSTYFDKNIHIVLFEIVLDGTSYISIDEDTYSYTGSSSTGTKSPILLFSHRGYYNSEGRIYYCKLYDEGTLVLDLIPVRVGHVGYMYDKISRLLLGNNGSGSFILGPDKLPNGLHDYSLDYFTIESLLDNNEIKMQRAKTPNNPILSYSLDDGETWTTATISGTKSFGTINTGDKIIFKGTNTSLASAWDTYNYFNATKQFKVYGNIMSLLNGEDFITNSEFQTNTNNQFAGLLRTTYLVDASNLILPALTLYRNCYNGMFRGDTNLVYGPKLLPALDVPADGYSSMFEGCTSLVEAPEILATTVSGNTALSRMFCMNRNSKVTAAMTKGPVLRITNPGSFQNVYQQLFCGNGNLVEITVLINGTDRSFTNWLNNVSSTGVIKTLSGTTFASGVSGLPSGWTVEDYVES